MNDPFVHAQAAKFAARLIAAGPATTRRASTLAYQLALTAPPTADEQDECSEFLQSYRDAAGGTRDAAPTSSRRKAWAAFARALLERQ